MSELPTCRVAKTRLQADAAFAAFGQTLDPCSIRLSPMAVSSHSFPLFAWLQTYRSQCLVIINKVHLEMACILNHEATFRLYKS